MRLPLRALTRPRRRASTWPLGENRWVRTRLSSLSTLAKVGAKLKDKRGKPIVGSNPVATVELPKRKRPPEKSLTPVELAAFIEVPRPLRVSVARDLLIDLGLRASKLCNTKWAI